MMREFSVVIERDEDGFYVASVPALPGCHTQARSLDELIERARGHRGASRRARRGGGAP
jgi:predicted RNase H-like HicB family nuclease